MPIYDVSCSECNKTYEVFASMDDQHTPCPVCKTPTTRLITPCNFEFKCAMETASGGANGVKYNCWNPGQPGKKKEI